MNALKPMILGVFVSVAAACSSETPATNRAESAASACPEATYRDSAGNPRSVSTRAIRFCFPGEANCFCDRDNDCYALKGYQACVPVAADAGTDSAMDVTARNCAETVYRDSAGTPRSVSTRQIRFCFPGEARCFCDRDGDCYAEPGYLACIPLPVTDGGAADARADTATQPDVVADTSTMFCAEAVYRDSAGTPRSVSTRQIRFCFPGEARCFCDRDGDCYAEPGYLACVPLPVTDGGAADVRTDTATQPDVVADTSTMFCPEAVYRDSAGIPRSVSTRQIRFCFPGELRCFCDRDNDCYAEPGYVACVQRGTTDAGVDARVDVIDSGVDVGPDVGPDVGVDAGVDVVTSDAPPVGPDPIAYNGTFADGTGYGMRRLTVAGMSRDVWVYVPATRTANPPLIVAFHGTNADGDVMIQFSGLQALADRFGVVVVAPTSRWFGGEGGDYDHPSGDGTYWETRTTDINTNADLMLTRAAIVEASRRYNVNLNRVYSMGHSNGGFMAYLVSVVLRDRIAAFAENSAGMVTCTTRSGCYFQGTGTTCGGLSTQSGWCGCSSASNPIAVPTSGRVVPGYLSHAVNDPIVSVFYTCALASRLSAAGATVETYLWSGGHDLSSSFAGRAWTFLSRYSL
jgi:predicted esterase